MSIGMEDISRGKKLLIFIRMRKSRWSRNTAELPSARGGLILRNHGHEDVSQLCTGAERKSYSEFSLGNAGGLPGYGRKTGEPQSSLWIMIQSFGSALLTEKLQHDDCGSLEN